MDTISAVRLFSDGRMSMHDTRALLMSMGHSAEDCARAFVSVIGLPGTSVRVGAYQKEEMQAELYLTVQ
jgi:hypothetical protein